ncbi:hypothetical protein MTR67_006363 [Solanum verrucosum]|uniref:TF-B3 domain-containing protein n=1 Tax=Solanum verrucosum TaxID=315347 RepID=A0AAF0PY65_SOLVR|nr:hypothetical protein MTR67_006363 [Solanum verrucosum]
MVKNQQASIYDEGSKRKRPEKYPYTSKFPKQTLANGENDTEHATPRKRAALEKEEDLLTDLTPNIPQFVKCLKGYNVKKYCFLYVRKSFCEQLSKSDNKTTVVLRISEGKRWKVNCITQNGYHALCGGWKQFGTDDIQLVIPFLLDSLLQMKKTGKIIFYVNEAGKVMSDVKKTGKMIFGMNFGFTILSIIDKHDRKR